MALSQDPVVHRHKPKSSQRQLSAKEREELLRPYLPRPMKQESKNPQRTRAVRGFLTNQFHLLIYTILHLAFSIYIVTRQTYHAVFDRVLAILYYHHRTPGLIRQDVKDLTRLPEHLSVILELKRDGSTQTNIESLVDEISEIAAWCSCVGIPMLSVYEKTGILKNYIPSSHRAICDRMHAYFGDDIPSVQIGAPTISAYLDGSSSAAARPASSHLSILLLSAEDGRSTLVDLTKTFAEMSQRKKLSIDDITQDLVDIELTESVMGEPDLLILFGPRVLLQGYPPWQIRLSEIYHVQDNNGVGYQVFLRALHNYAKAQMKFGR